MEIYLEEGQALGEAALRKIKEAAEILLQKEGVDAERAELSLTLVSPEEIRELNREYRGVDVATDVLSFPQFESGQELPAAGEICLGDVVICDGKIREQAAEFGHSYERELVYLFVHSLLHLLGYDHMEEDEKELMRKREEEIMEAVDLRR